MGSANLLVDSNGNILREEQRYPYGLDRRIEGTATADYVYTGKELDEETGLIYFGGRYYVPELGRWASPDPLFVESPEKTIGLPRSYNHYSYCYNNPHNYVDHDGNVPVIAVAITVVTVGMLIGAAGQAISDYRNNKDAEWENYVGSSVGGAWAGGITMTSANPILGAMSAGAIGAGIKQGLRYITRGESPDPEALLTDTVTAGIVGKIVPMQKIPGVTVGRGSYAAIAEQMKSKIESGIMQNIKPTVLGKVAIGNLMKDSTIENTMLSSQVSEMIYPGQPQQRVGSSAVTDGAMVDSMLDSPLNAAGFTACDE